MEEMNFQENYESLNNQYKQNKIKQTKIFLSIFLAFVFVLSTLIITFSCVNYSSRPTFVLQPSYIEVSLDGRTINFDGENDEYDEVFSLYKKSFDYSYLTAIFTGSRDYKITETTDKFYSSYSNSVGTGMSTTLKNNLGSDYIHFHYVTEQTIYSSNGSVYNTASKTDGSVALTYFDVYFKISAENELNDVTFYFGTLGIAQQPRITSLTVKANTSKLCNYISEL